MPDSRFRHLSSIMIASALAVAVVIFMKSYCLRPVREGNPKDPDVILTTAYCNCGKCCSWRYKWFFFGEKVYTYGKLKGKTKLVGVTSSGKTAKHGTIAADLKVFPYGTRLYVPGYGEGVVEDTGGAIKGRHIDLWFPSHGEAKKWGRRYLKVKKLSD